MLRTAEPTGDDDERVAKPLPLGPGTLAELHAELLRLLAQLLQLDRLAAANSLRVGFVLYFLLQLLRMQCRLRLQFVLRFMLLLVRLVVSPVAAFAAASAAKVFVRKLRLRFVLLLRFVRLLSQLLWLRLQQGLRLQRRLRLQHRLRLPGDHAEAFRAAQPV